MFPGNADERSLLEVVEPSHSAEEYVIRLERQLRVRQAIRRLPPNLRKVAEIRQSQDGSIVVADAAVVKEIAMIAGLSVPATKSRLTRATLTRQSLAGS